jgi:DNA invertase Pin-like site-specific DNA recombinase
MIQRPPKRALLFARVSTGKQSHRAQLEALKACCLLREFIVEHVVIETAGAGDPHREALRKVKKIITSGGVDVLLVHRCDRLARSVRELLDIAEICSNYNVDLVSRTEPIDTTTGAGRFFFTVMAAVSEFERDLIRERVRAGMSAARARGFEPGRPCVPREIREEIARLRNEGFSFAQVAEKIPCGVATAHKYGRHFPRLKASGRKKRTPTG